MKEDIQANKAELEAHAHADMLMTVDFDMIDQHMRQIHSIASPFHWLGLLV